MTSRCIAVTLSAALLLGDVGCASVAGLRGSAHCPVAAVPVESFSSALPLRAQMRFWAEEREAALDVVAVRDGEDVLIVGLAPFGPRLFTLRQVGRTPKLSLRAPRGTFPPPIWVFDALHRIFWIAPPGPAAAEPASSWEWEGEQVSEVLGTDGGRQRAFGRSDDGGGAVIEYPPPTDPESAAIVMRSTWCGFEAKVLPIGDRRP